MRDVTAPDLAEEARALLQAMSKRVPWLWNFDPYLQHAVPQTWYVWSQLGKTQCDCVIEFGKAIEILESLNATHERNAANFVRNHSQQERFAQLLASVSNGTLPRAWYSLNQGDLALWRAARSSRELCYRPPDLADQFSFAKYDTPSTLQTR